MALFEILSTCRGGGYRYARTNPPHPKANSNGLYPLHRVLVENALGRQLGPGEVVHHRDGNKTNDDPSNLEVLTNSEHSRLHRPEVFETLICPCGAEFQLNPAARRKRERQKRTPGPLACSRRCGARQGHAAGR